MSKLYENGVVGKIRIPDNARILKELHTADYGLVALLLDVEGNEITYLHLKPLGLQHIAWNSEPFGDDQFHDEVPENILRNIEDNGGIFVSKYPLGFNESGKLVSKTGSNTITNINFHTAQQYAQDFKLSELTSQILTGCIYDTIGALLIQTGLVSENDYLYASNEDSQSTIMYTDRGGFCLHNFFGNIYEAIWTSEQYDSKQIVTRMGTPHTDGEGYYNARMRYTADPNFKRNELKTRIVFCI